MGYSVSRLSGNIQVANNRKDAIKELKKSYAHIQKNGNEFTSKENMDVAAANTEVIKKLREDNLNQKRFPNLKKYLANKWNISFGEFRAINKLNEKFSSMIKWVNTNTGINDQLKGLLFDADQNEIMDAMWEKAIKCPNQPIVVLTPDENSPRCYNFIVATAITLVDPTKQDPVKISQGHVKYLGNYGNQPSFLVETLHPQTKTTISKTVNGVDALKNFLAYNRTNVPNSNIHHLRA